MDNTPQISVVIPAYNEHRYIGGTVQTIVDYLTPRYERFEVIVVDDGSKDDTYSVVDNLHLILPPHCTLQTLVNQVNSGKGYSIQRGVLASHGEIVVFTDADLSYDLSVINLLAEKIQKGADVAIGSRLAPGSQIHTQVPMVRSFTGRAFNTLVQVFLFKGIDDTQCGVKGFSRESALQIFPRQTIKQFSFDVEILYIARLFGYSVAQVPVNLVNYRKESRVNVITDSWKMLWDIFRIRGKGMLGKYNIKPENK